MYNKQGWRVILNLNDINLKNNFVRILMLMLVHLGKQKNYKDFIGNELLKSLQFRFMKLK